MNIDNNFNIPLTEIKNGKWLDPLYENVKFYGFNWIKEILSIIHKSSSII